MILHILHMANFKTLALIATEIQGKTSAEMAEMVTDSKTILPAVFQKRAGGKNLWCRMLDNIKLPKAGHKNIRSYSWNGIMECMESPNILHLCALSTYHATDLWKLLICKQKKYLVRHYTYSKSPAIIGLQKMFREACFHVRYRA